MTASAAASEVNVPALIDEQKISALQIRVALLCAAVVFMDGFDAQAIGYVAPTLSKAWNLAPGELGWTFSAGLVGLMLGALAFSPLADRIGRKPIIVFCTLWFGITSLLTVTAESTTSLLVWRFITGLGLGGAIAAQLVPSYGWQSVFWIGGIFPILLAPILIFWLPESIRLLSLRGTQDDYVAGLLRAINPALRFAPGTRFVAPEEHPEGFPVEHLFTEGRAVATVLIWVMFFTNLLVIYFCATWLPTVINNTGVSVRLAVIATALFQVGGIVGTLVLAFLIERFGPYRVLAGAYFAAAILIAAIGQAGSAIELIIPAVFGAGFCVVGAQIGANALTATFYPTFIRSTGVGWALGIGRIGSIIGPLLGGMMLSLQWHIPTIFFAGAIPVLIACAAVFAMGRLPKTAKDQGASAVPT